MKKTIKDTKKYMFEFSGKTKSTERAIMHMGEPKKAYLVIEYEPDVFVKVKLDQLEINLFMPDMIY